MAENEKPEESVGDDSKVEITKIDKDDLKKIGGGHYYLATRCPDPPKQDLPPEGDPMGDPLVDGGDPHAPHHPHEDPALDPMVDPNMPPDGTATV